MSGALRVTVVARNLTVPPSLAMPPAAEAVLCVTRLPFMIRRPRLARPPPEAAELPDTLLPAFRVLGTLADAVAAGLDREEGARLVLCARRAGSDSVAVTSCARAEEVRPVTARSGRVLPPHGRAVRPA